MKWLVIKKQSLLLSITQMELFDIPSRQTTFSSTFTLCYLTTKCNYFFDMILLLPSASGQRNKAHLSWIAVRMILMPYGTPVTPVDCQKVKVRLPELRKTCSGMPVYVATTTWEESLCKNFYAPAGTFSDTPFFSVCSSTCSSSRFPSTCCRCMIRY